MGFFSWDCKVCKKSLRAPNGYDEGQEWMNRGVALIENGSVIIGEYDGYGGLGSFELTDHQPSVYHEKCWIEAGKPYVFDGPSESAFDQGFLIVRKNMRNQDLAFALDNLNKTLCNANEITLDAAQLIDQAIYGLRNSENITKLLESVALYLVDECSMTDKDEILRDVRLAIHNPVISDISAIGPGWEELPISGAFMRFDEAIKLIAIGPGGMMRIWNKKPTNT